MNYIVFLFSVKDNNFGDILDKNLTKEQAKSKTKEYKEQGLPVFFEDATVMEQKYGLK